MIINILNSMLAILLSVHDYATSVDVTRSLVYVSEKTFGKDSFETAERYLQLADLLVKNEMFNEAYLYNELAIKIYAMMLGENDDKVKKCYQLKGICLMQRGQREEALKCMEVVMTMKDRSAEEVMNATFYACLMNA